MKKIIGVAILAAAAVFVLAALIHQGQKQENPDPQVETQQEIALPDSGHTLKIQGSDGQITQMDYGQTDFTTYVAKRVPKLIVDQANDLRKLRYACRPLAAPKNYTPWIYMESVIS